MERDTYRVAGVGGTPLEAVVYRPAHPAKATPHSHPVVVLPTSWASPPSEYTLLLEWLADSGYLAVAYMPRGFLGSGGRIEVASPTDVGDFGAVLDWILAEFPIADPDRVAAVGLSYGAGISLLAAAADRRLKTVVAVDGWADLFAAVNPGETPRLSTALLADGGLLGGRPSPSLVEAVIDYYSGRHRQRFRRWTAERSAASVVEEINDRPVTLLLAAGWNDTVLRPEQTVAFHHELTGRAVLLLHPGDHPVVPFASFLGRAADVWTYVRRWLDHELLGLPTGVEDDGPVIILRPDGTDQHEETSCTPPGELTRHHLGPPPTAGNGKLSDRPAAWEKRLVGGLPSGAVDRVPVVSQWAETLGLSPMVFFPLLPGLVAGSWLTEPFHEVMQVRGSPHLRLSVSSPKSATTLTAHLYEVDRTGLGRLLTQATATVRTGNGAVPVDLRFRTTVAEVHEGRRIGLVVGTVDPTCVSRTLPFSKVVLHSRGEAPALLSLRLRRP
ncbi:CocE/NonD family hydrolase [Streptomyces paromomycinus]|uniref:CocE/NonD family hydrolase n=1 Tax=Streptomyces paromomycinus TaxID=92743 RepID=UPI001479728B|nr:CocE/NonD family hydrolase [Streptomyces paromomycinus]